MANYKYVFTHNKTKAKLKFISNDFNNAILLLANMVNAVSDWDMKKYKCK